MLRSSLCDCSNAYILVKGAITVAKTAAQGQTNNGGNKKVILKNCTPFINCVSRINNTRVDDARYIDAVMTVFNLIEYSDNDLKTSGTLWEIYRDVSAVDDAGATNDFTEANAIT